MIYVKTEVGTRYYLCPTSTDFYRLGRNIKNAFFFCKPFIIISSDLTDPAFLDLDLDLAESYSQKIINNKSR